MTILTLNKKDLEKKIGKIDEKIKNKIDMFGTPIDSENDNEINIEIFPNRPDLLSLQGFTRSLNNFLGKGKIKDYKAEKLEKNYKVIIEKSVKKVRPYTVCAIVKGLNFNDEKIKEVIDIQEKIHLNYGKNRKKLAVGIYPLEEINLPIKFLAKKPEEIKFQPLDFMDEINARQILNQHPAGREYGHLLKDCEVFPVFEDAKGNVLSMPPIINSEKTGKINEKTKDVFIECSGFSKEYLEKALNMIVCNLADLGGKIYAMEIEDENGRFLSPNLEPEKMEFSINYINKNLGLELTEKEIIKHLKKMGVSCEKNKSEKSKIGDIVALVPPYRTDIIHEIDLAEEVAIAYGYDNFKPEIPKISTIGQEDSISILKRKIAEILIGLGIQEISTYHLSTKERQFKKVNIKEFKDSLIEVINSKTENNILRTSLIANSIQILGENSDASYPQKIFELGKVFCNDKNNETGVGEKERLCISLCHEQANFTELKQVLDYFIRMFNKSYELKEIKNESFIDGRAGSIIINGKDVGVIGEIHPVVLRNNKIKMPVSSLEIDIEIF